MPSWLRTGRHRAGRCGATCGRGSSGQLRCGHGLPSVARTFLGETDVPDHFVTVAGYIVTAVLFGAESVTGARQGGTKIVER